MNAEIASATINDVITKAERYEDIIDTLKVGQVYKYIGDGEFEIASCQCGGCKSSEESNKKPLPQEDDGSNEWFIWHLSKLISPKNRPHFLEYLQNIRTPMDRFQICLMAILWMI